MIYRAVEPFLRVANIEEEQETAEILAEAERILTVSSEVINEFTDRDFTPAGDPTAQTFDVPVGSYLAIPEFQIAPTPPTVTLYGVLIAAERLRFVRHQKHPIYVGIILLDVLGRPQDWAYGAVAHPYNAITVTASWGWAAVPPKIEQACEEIAAQVWTDRETIYAAGGNGVVGLRRAAHKVLTDRVYTLLVGYVRGQVKNIVARVPVV